MAKRQLHLHERRRITFQEYGALLATRELLARGDLEFAPGRDCPLPGLHQFNMGTKGEKYKCGSIGCIGGTMALIMGVNISWYVNSGSDREPGRLFSEGTSLNERTMCSQSLGKLFYPPGASSHEWRWITPWIAVKAIDNWLRTGRPAWKSLQKASKRKTKR